MYTKDNNNFLNWQTFTKRWQEVEEKAKEEIEKPALKSIIEIAKSNVEEIITAEKEYDKNALIGECCHWVMAQLDFNNPVQHNNLLKQWFSFQNFKIIPSDKEELQSKCIEILRNFLSKDSKVLKWLQEKEIIQRELPISFYKDKQVIIGRIDFLCKDDNDTYFIVDYKTQIYPESLKLYTEQIKLYKEALVNFYTQIKGVIISLKEGNIQLLDI